MRFADFDAMVITGRAKTPSALIVASRQIEIRDVHYLWGTDLQVAGKILRRMFPGAGHRTILRIGPPDQEPPGNCRSCDRGNYRREVC